ncbi:hypothetical protein CYMTET_36122, partial [Cymbomonas tetramitiformis]
IRRFQPKDIVLAKGAVGSYMCIVVDGDLEIHEGMETLSAKPGDVVAEMAMYYARPMQHEVVAKTAATLLTIGLQELETALQQYPEQRHVLEMAAVERMLNRIKDDEPPVLFFGSALHRTPIKLRAVGFEVSQMRPALGGRAAASTRGDYGEPLAGVSCSPLREMPGTTPTPAAASGPG